MEIFRYALVDVEDRVALEVKGPVISVGLAGGGGVWVPGPGNEALSDESGNGLQDESGNSLFDSGQ